MAEGARLESVYTGNRIVGSNPTPSASDLSIREASALSAACRFVIGVVLNLFFAGAGAAKAHCLFALRVSGVVG